MSEVSILRKGSGKEVDAHVKQCMRCKQQNLCPQHYAQLQLEVPLMPMHFIVVD